MNVYLKWLIIVSLNAILGFYFGYEADNYPNQIGMIAGVLTWSLLYLTLDLYLIKQQKYLLSKRLTISACLRIPLQLIAYIEMYAGLFAMVTVEFIGISDPLGKGFVEAYLMTFFTGLYLSCVCGALFLLVSLVDHFRLRRQSSTTKS